MTKDRRHGPWRPLALLAGPVLAAHLLLLQGNWPVLTPSKDRWVQVFTTRTIAPAPAAPSPPAPVPVPSAPVAAAPLQKRQEPAAPAAPAPRPPARTGEQAAPPAPAAPPEQAAPAASAASAPSAPYVPGTIAVPQPALMRYEVTATRGGLTLAGEARLDWWHNGQQYDLRMEVSAPGLPARKQHSTGQITDEGLAPERFSDKSRSEQATHFDRAKGRIVFSNNQPQAAIAPGMQDRLSVIVQLSMLLGGEPERFVRGTQVAIPTASTRDAEDWIFSVEGEEDLSLPGGIVPAVKLQRLPRREYDQRIELWLAPRKDYAPVRVRLTNPDGGTLDHRWSSTDRR